MYTVAHTGRGQVLFKTCDLMTTTMMILIPLFKMENFYYHFIVLDLLCPHCGQPC